jgi:polar amino acid transport system substrate-binding protein
MIKILTVIILVFFTSSALACTESESKLILSKLQWITEDYPPYNYPDEYGHLVGAFPEVLALIYSDLSIKRKENDIGILPWPRLLLYMKLYPEYAAFSMVSTPERANKYRLVSMPITTRISIMALKSNINILQHKSFNEITVAVVRGDIGQQLLDNQKNPAQQVETIAAGSMLQMLFRNRVDTISYSEDVSYYQLKKLGAKRDSITPIHVLKDDLDINFVFHKSTSNCVIDLFTKTLTTLNSEGQLKPILKKYHLN